MWLSIGDGLRYGTGATGPTAVDENGTATHPHPVRIDDSDIVDGGGGGGNDEDRDQPAPGTHAGCHSRSIATTVATLLTIVRRWWVASVLSRMGHMWLSVSHDRWVDGWMT